MRRTHLASSFALLLAAAPSQRDPAPPSPVQQPLRVLWLGNADTPRAASFRDFLAHHFRTVVAAARDGFERGTEQDFDVVVLDWSQGDVDIMKMRELRSPLGERAGWTKPLVLLGSAGLLLGGCWDLTGTYG